MGVLTWKVFSQGTPNDMILLIRYAEETECKILKTDNYVDADKYHCDEIYEEIDDFSEFFPKEKVFYYDGEIELIPNDKILFWEYGYNKIISELPFKYSDLKIDSLLTSGTIIIQIEKKQFELAVHCSFTDTIKKTEVRNQQTVLYKKIISLENLGLIEKKNIIDNKTWETQKYKLGLDALLLVEVMPVFQGGSGNLLEYLTERIEYPTVLENSEMMNTKIYIEFIINEIGDIEKIKVLRSINPSFDKHVCDILQNMPKWTPGMQDGKPVPVKMILPINIDIY